MAVTSAKGYELQTTGSNSGTWGTVLNTDVFQIVDNNMGGIVTKALTNANVTLTSDEAENLVVRLIGTISANILVTNACVGFWYCENRTTGAFTITVTNGVGTPLEIPQGYCVAVIADATNGCRYGNDNPGEVFIASGASSSEGLVPDPGATEGAGRYLREDATFVVPPFQWTPGGRLTLTSGTPVTTGDVFGATSVYYTAMNGNTVPVYGSCASAPTQFAPVTITGGELTLTLNNPNHAANTNYDVFCFLDGSTVRIGTGPPWISSTSRGTGAGTTQISLASGLWTNTVSMTVRNGASTYSVAAGVGTYLGTIRTRATAGTTEDSKERRFVFNAYNAVLRPLSVVETTNSWIYSTNTWRQANANSSNQVQVVLGIDSAAVNVKVHGVALFETISGTSCATGIGVDSTSSNSAQTYGAVVGSGAGVVPSEYFGYPGIGYHYLAWLENGGGFAFVYWYGTKSGSPLQSGMTGGVWA